MGCGAYFPGNWFFLPWPADWENKEILKDICFLEMILVVLAIEVWGLPLTILHLLVLLINKPLSPKVDGTCEAFCPWFDEK